MSLVAVLMLAACESHIDVIDDSLKIGDVLCTDGRTMSLDDALAIGSTPVAVIFYINVDTVFSGEGLAVWFRDLAPAAVADTLGYSQGTSSSVVALDGNENTYAMYSCTQGFSPAATEVFDMWSYGQSAYLPSVAQMSLLRKALPFVNATLSGIEGGEPLSTYPDSCWYWTSTEVNGQDAHKVWLYSIASGSFQETPKDEFHSVRPVLTINR